MTDLIKRHGAGGELSPAIGAMVDLAKYGQGWDTQRNMWTNRSGIPEDRPGFSWVASTKILGNTCRLISWSYSSQQTYMLEFGDKYIRFFQNGAPVLVSGVAAYNAGTGYAIGNLVSNAGINYYCIAATTGNAPPNVTYWYPLTGNIFEIPSPYAFADLPLLKKFQSLDVMWLLHPLYPIQNLNRFGQTNWTLIKLNLNAFVSPVADAVSGAAGAGGANQYYYQVTAFDKVSNKESLPIVATAYEVSAIAASNPCKVTTTGPTPFVTGDQIQIAIAGGVVGKSQIDNNDYIVTVIDNKNFTLNGIDATSFNVDLDVTRTAGRVTISLASAAPTLAAPNVISWVVLNSPLDSNFIYNIYQSLDGVNFGYLGSSTTSSFSDVGLPPTAQRPPFPFYGFLSPGNYPSVGTIYQDRVVLAKTINQPTGVWASQISFYNSFGIPPQPVDSDPIQFNLQNDNGAVIQEFVEIGLLLIGSDQAEYLIFGDPSGAFIPSAINARKQAFNGFSTLKPLIVNKNALFVQARGSQVRDLQLQTTFYTFIQGSDDLSQYAQHLLDGHTIMAWDYQKIYNSIAWMVREDGILLGLTYIKEQDIVAWHRHDTRNGFFEDVAVIAEGGEDMVYVIVRRVINGQTVRFVERLNTRVIADLEDFNFADASSSYDGRNTSAITMTIIGGFAWLNTEIFTLTSSAPFFDGSDAGGILGGGGNQIILTCPDGTILRFRITTFIDAQTVVGRVQKTVPVAMRNLPVTTWAKAVYNLIALDYLEGQQVAVLADGFEPANPLDIKKPILTVTNGMITLPNPAAVIHVGLPITRDLKTLNTDMAQQGETISDKKMIFREVGVKVMNSVGFFVARTFPPATDSNPVGTGQNAMIECKVRTTEPLGSPQSLQTQLIPTKIPGKYDSTGQIAIRHIRMTPLSVLAVVLAGDLPEQQGRG